MDCNMLNDKINQADKFLAISDKLLTLTNLKKVEKKTVDECLNQINNLNYKLLVIPENNTTMLLINNLCKYIQSTDTKLIINYCLLIQNLIEAEINLSSRTFLLCKKWILEVLEYGDNFVLKEVLITLKSIIEISSFESINKDMNILLENKSLLKNLVIFESSNVSDINVLALICVEAFLKNCEQNEGKIPIKYKIIIKNITLEAISQIKTLNQTNEIHFHKIVCCCLRIWQYLMADKLLKEDKTAVGELFGIIQAFMFYGIDGYITLKPKVLHPATLDLPAEIQMSHICSRTKNISRPRTKKQQIKKSVIESSVKTSKNVKAKKSLNDSDSSDSESMNLNVVDSIIRFETIQLLNRAIAEIASRDMFTYWSQIIINTSDSNARVLMWLIIKEPSSKLRQCALGVLTEAILNARMFLGYAEESDHSTFITFFETVAVTLRKLHLAISDLINTEQNVAVIIHALKCAAALAQVTPYIRLKSGLASQLTQVSKCFIVHKDPTVRVAALSVFESLISGEHITSEIISIISEKSTYQMNEYLKMSFKELSISNTEINDFESEEIDCADINYSEKYQEIKSRKIKITSEISFLVEICLKNISNKNIQVPVRLQSLKLLNALIKPETEKFIVNYLEIITEYLIELTREIETQIIFHACRVIEKISFYLDANSILKENELQYFWNTVFDPLIFLINSPHSNLREVVCDCFGTISNNVFSQFPRNRSILIITMLFSLVRDEESAVRAGGLRALGMLVTLPSLEENTEFIFDMADIVCTALEDINLGVRVKAAWALANITDCLIRQITTIDTEQFALKNLLQNFHKICLKATQDNNKVKCNALRAFGNIIYLHQYFQIKIEDIAIGLEMLISCATLGNDMKVRWNACRAIGLILKHDSDVILPSNWRDIIIPPLCLLIHQSLNFKVRTNAAWAITCCHSYGKYISLLWKSIVLAFENAQSVPSFIEYNHRDALIQQLCLALAHVAIRTNASDLQKLWPEIKDHIQDIKDHLRYFQECAVPEKANDLIDAKLNLNKYVQVTSNMEEKKIAQILVDLFDSNN